MPGIKSLVLVLFRGILVMLIGNNLTMIQLLIQQLHDVFPLKDSGKLKYFLGIQVVRHDVSMFLNQ